MYIKVSKNATDCVDFSWSNLIESCFVLRFVRNSSSWVSRPVYIRKMSSMYLA